MAIHDSDPERRNLMVTSLAFIAYFYAGGSFSDSEVRLQVINANFSKPAVLAFFAWALLIWFLYRYWQKHSNSFSEGFDSEIHGYYTKPYFSKYASKKLGQPMVGDRDEGYHIDGMIRGAGSLSLKYSYASSVGRDEKTGQINSWSNRKNDDRGKIELNDFMGRCLRFRAYIECCFRNPSFSNYVVPYIVFLIAVIGPLYKCVL